ncbi:TPA: flagellar motor stator protein MotA [Providencia stuartii]|uniref:Flagellar motor stator protein MotA n=5 Tax=Providencia stuartii TaxID=588 RepID=A0AAJ1JIA0_PROST|nr:MULTISPECIES: flagellar motor stator protein MotA [Providencia]SST02655.1 Chemotaxis protein MotA [Acinetobacter baumannii]AFH95429.1 flagellar motor protein MotA [Providencia stuartii MRSN 2154]AIN62356.1 flagellar motor stator protein MotA [Providencia stuartii]AMG66419.1 flagellar motor stator protein MotA [Providencia stuartii]APG49490.1 flagellar motor stator protein MotA [Providencia stuartii]
MLILIGYIIVTGTVIGGYLMLGGHLGALYQPAEFVIILGAGFGAFVVGNSGKSIIALCKVLPRVFRRSSYNKAMSMDLMALLFQLLNKSRQEGLLALEKDIENPQESEIFSQYPRVLKDKTTLMFVVDYLRLMVTSNLQSHEIEALMDEELETFRQESEVPASGLNMVGDSMPAFGIVAAVLGVVNALGSADRPAGELGALIAHAMVGTFLGILVAYGFILPLAALIRLRTNEQLKMLECIKVTFLSALQGYAPQIAVEFGRKVLYSADRPSFMELEDKVREVKISHRSQAQSEE